MPSPIEVGRRGGQRIMFTPKERATALHVMGSSGQGKSKLAEYMIRQDIRAGHGVLLIDPHGTLYKHIVDWCAYHDVHRHRTIHLINPSEGDWTVGYNPLWVREGEDITRRVDRVVDGVSQVWGGEDLSVKPRLTKMLRAIVYVLAFHRLSLIESRDLLSSSDQDQLRTQLTRDLSNLEFQRFWNDFNDMRKREIAEYFDPPDSRFMEFITSPAIKAMLGSIENPIDFQKCMDNDEIVLVNLSESNKLSPKNARVIGTLIFNELFSLASERSEELGAQHPFYLYVDECYDYLSDDIERMLVQSRKRGLHITLIHHYLEQLRDAGKKIYYGVKSNAQTKIIFGGIDDDDAEILARELFRTEFDLNQVKTELNKPVPTGRFYRETLTATSESAGEFEAEGMSTTDVLGSLSGVTELYGADGTVISAQSVTNTESGSTAAGSSSVRGSSLNRSVSEHEVLVPEYAIMPTALKSLEEVTHDAIVRLRSLTEQFAIIKKPGQRSVYIKIPFVQEQKLLDVYRDQFIAEVTANNPHALPREKALTLVDQRRDELVGELQQGTAIEHEEDFFEDVG